MFAAKLEPIIRALLTVGMALALAGCERPGAAPAAQPAAPREPSRLEVRLPIDMGEMFFATAEGAKGGPFRVPTGKVVGLRAANKGALEHEVAFGRELVYQEGRPDSFRQQLFKDLLVDVFVYPAGKKVEVETDGGVAAIEMEPGTELWVRVTFPPEVKGEWEMACFIAGHYEQGMTARFIIE